VYWYALFYYGDPELHDYVFYVTAWSAFALRIAAWGKTRTQRALKASDQAHVPTYARMAGMAVIGVGLVLAVSGNVWGMPVLNWVLEPAWAQDFSNWVPFWPLIDFYSLFVLGIGTWLLTAYRSPQAREVGVPATG
ncbi:MAG: hypothetical protein AAGH19_12200, partial [Pseudomonadota bacterium]